MDEESSCQPQEDDSKQETENKTSPVLSKNQLKKQRRHERWAETKKERRKKEREKNKDRKRKMLEEARKQGIDEESLVVKKRKMSDPEASNIKVAIDCAYDSLMTESDIKKLIKQIQRCYAENRKANKPLQLYVSSLKDKTKQILDDVIEGYQKWDIHFREEEPEAAFGSENIVYLAAESPNVLQDLDPNKAYIIGGLVDHNHYKGYCYEKVIENGWSHAQLPIGDFVKLNSRKVLAVNHVYEIILAYVQLGNWKDAFFQVLPNRKVKEYYSKNNSTEDLGKLSSHTETSVQDQTSRNVDDSVADQTNEDEGHSVVARLGNGDGDLADAQTNKEELGQDVVDSVKVCDTRSRNDNDLDAAKEIDSDKLDSGVKPTDGEIECEDKDVS
nr:tRNA methyltransferase 10 homolog A-like isoform X1 [Lytechinus pictus]